jgi:signal transduction histidine kinase
MSIGTYVLVFSVYGLAFYSMGLALLLEGGRGSDLRLRQALRPLAAFAFLHALHEWIEAYDRLNLLPWQDAYPVIWDSFRLAILAFSFLSLAAFGSQLLASTERNRRLSMLVPIVLAAIWGVGLLIMQNIYAIGGGLFEAAEAWTRYVLAVPASLLAAAGLVAQQRAFRRAGMIRFGRDCLWAAIAFVWYGLVGQVFVHASPLPPSNTINQELFFEVFGIPIQVLRATTAVIISILVIRVLRSFDVETQRRITELQASQLEEAHRREALRGELLKRVVAAQEAERQRIARELHDATGQSLTALGLGLSGVLITCQRREPEQVESRVRELMELNSKTLDELRHLIADLRPSHLDDLGLPSALRWYTKEVQSRVPLEIHIEISGDERPLDSAVNTALFRVAQEALTNIIKYANTPTAWVRLAYAAQAVVLEVEDRGIGFDTSAPALSNRSAWGLLGMQERAELLGGAFELHSNRGSGTCVRVTIPYHRQMDETSESSTTLAPSTLEEIP